MLDPSGSRDFLIIDAVPRVGGDLPGADDTGVPRAAGSISIAHPLQVGERVRTLSGMAVVLGVSGSRATLRLDHTFDEIVVNASGSSGSHWSTTI